jgi:hypothetical protein
MFKGKLQLHLKYQNQCIAVTMLRLNLLQFNMQNQLNPSTDIVTKQNVQQQREEKYY